MLGFRCTSWRHSAVAARVGLHVRDGPQHDDHAGHERDDAEQRQHADQRRGRRARRAAAQLPVRTPCLRAREGVGPGQGLI